MYCLRKIFNPDSLSVSISTLFWFISLITYAQVSQLSGSDICGDGRQTTMIGISGIDPGKYYALYRNDEMLQVRRSSVEGNDQAISFGSFKEIGIYSASAFDKVVDGFPAKLGKPVKGKITISPVPLLYMGDTLKIKSGELLHYVPRADLQGATFSWSTSLKYGKVSTYIKKGSNAIDDTIQVAGDSPACIVYSITPQGAAPIVSCNGEPRDLVVIIRR